ncbi:MAG: hypothetical protein K0S51_898 [Bacillales bacterium]|jgi:hypothetical protein|nr:hypothetical protein [Bacillales bacterium]
MNEFFLFLLFALASYRLTRVIVFDKIAKFIRNPFIEEKEVVEEDGTVSYFTKLKYNSGILCWLGQLLSCYWCVGVWVATGFYTFYAFFPAYALPLIYIFAIAGAASIIETIILKLID